MRSGIVASSQNRGSRAPGSTFSPISGSESGKTWNRGRRCSSTSPSHYTKSLYVDCPHAIAAADAEAGGWITGPSRVVRLEIGDNGPTSRGSAVSPDITCDLPSMSTQLPRPHWYPPSLIGSNPTLIDLSNATRLQDVAFRVNFLHNVDWITTKLQTLTPEHQDLRRISIYIPYKLPIAVLGANIRRVISDTTYGQLLDFDRLLIQFWESRSIRLIVTCTKPIGMQNMRSMRDDLESLLPEVTRRGIMDLVE